MILELAVAFALTVISEFLVVLAFIGKDAKMVFLYDFLINLFSWPLAVLAYYGFGVNLYVVEICVCLAESVLIMLLFGVRYRRALVISAAANLASFLLGVFLSLFPLIWR